MRRLFLNVSALFVVAVLASAMNPGQANADDEKIKANLAKLNEADRKIAVEQKICPIEEEALGASGVPIKVTVKGKAIFVCCKGCVEEVEKNPDKTIAKVEELKKKK